MKDKRIIFIAFNKLFFTLVLLSVLTVCCPAKSHCSADKERNNIDVALALDISGSMKKTDPLTLRVPAAKLFISLLDKKDRAGIIGFAENASVLAHLTPVGDQANVSALLNAAGRISSTGKHTNLFLCLDEAMKVLLDKKTNKEKQIIILMSDGQMDVGDGNKDRELVERLRNELLPELKSDGIKVYTIAFSKHSDMTLLNEISQYTGGFYNLALNASDLHEIFMSIFEALKLPQMLPIKSVGINEDVFIVDDAVDEAVIIINKKSSKDSIVLKSPEGSLYRKKGEGSIRDWIKSHNFDMVTLDNPSAGVWSILNNKKDANKAYIKTDLSLMTNFKQDKVYANATGFFEAWLERDKKVVRDPTVLNNTKMHVDFWFNGEKTDSKQLALDNAKGDGVFRGEFKTPNSEGEYLLSVLAKGAGFERKRNIPFKAKKNPDNYKQLKTSKTKPIAQSRSYKSKKEESSSSSMSMTGKLIILNVILAVIIFVVVRINAKRKDE